MTCDAGQLAARIRSLPRRNRTLIAIAGPPGSGKTTLAARLARELGAAVVPMDGFHLDNRVLEARGLRTRKGAPESFDVDGFTRLVGALKAGGEVIHPRFERDRDLAIAGAGVVARGCERVILEGNYLLFDAPRWRRLAAMWDISVWLDVAPDRLRARLLTRWRDQGLSEAEAQRRVEGNDMVNAARIDAARLPADVVL